MSGRRKKGTDGNQGEFIEDMNLIGASTLDLSDVGDGCGDVLVGYYGFNWLFEVKNPDQPESKRQLRKSQVDFKNRWRGQYAKVETSAEAMRLMGVPEKTIKQVAQARAAKRAFDERVRREKLNAGS